MLAVHNLDSKPHSITLATETGEGKRLVNLLTEEHSVADERGTHHIALEASGYRWFRVGSLRYLLNRQKV